MLILQDHPGRKTSRLRLQRRYGGRFQGYSAPSAGPSSHRAEKTHPQHQRFGGRRSAHRLRPAFHSPRIGQGNGDSSIRLQAALQRGTRRRTVCFPPSLAPYWGMVVGKDSLCLSEDPMRARQKPPLRKSLQISKPGASPLNPKSSESYPGPARRVKPWMYASAPNAKGAGQNAGPLDSDYYCLGIRYRF